MREYTAFASIGHGQEIAHALAEHEGLVHWVVRRQWLGDLPYAEALHIGRIALWQALRRYDPTRGTAFSTYAVPAIQRAVWRAVAQAQPHPQELLIPHPPQEAPDFEEATERVLVREALHCLVARLPRPLDYVIITRYGLHGRSPQTFAAIGRALSLSRERARQLHVEALLWLAHPAHSLALRKLLDRNTVADYQAYLARLRTWLRARRGIR
ncbi:MAG: sigma-70 family RNA polymerase sigma factor [Anaerolineales bacterium]|nr:sigma-70 family RNA polymerase sigma factor [Anaerolineales bacterium]